MQILVIVLYDSKEKRLEISNEISTFYGLTKKNVNVLKAENSGRNDYRAAGWFAAGAEAVFREETDRVEVDSIISFFAKSASSFD